MHFLTHIGMGQGLALSRVEIIVSLLQLIPVLAGGYRVMDAVYDAHSAQVVAFVLVPESPSGSPHVILVSWAAGRSCSRKVCRF